MSNAKKMSLILGSFLFLTLSGQKAVAQDFKVDKSTSSVIVEGTSNVHDWDEKAEDFDGSLALETEDGEVIAISRLKFSVVAESLESGKNGMNSNTYDALKTDDHKNITYKAQELIAVDCASAGECHITTQGDLSIAGTTKQVELEFDMTMTDNQMTLKGATDIDMTAYNIDPPRALLGAIKTGDEVTVELNIVFVK